MRALVTGASGFVGGHLVEHLLEAGDAVVGLSASGRWPAALAHLGRSARLEPWDLAAGSPADLADLLRRKQPQAIYHLAARANPAQSMADPRGTWEVNVGGTWNLLDAVRASGLAPRIVLVGSGICYGNPPPGHIPVTESCPLRPITPYAASKAAADLLGLQFALGAGADLVIARPFNHAGPRQSDIYALSSFARQVAEIELGRRQEIAVGNLDVVRDFTDVRDIARAYRLLAEKGDRGEVYNIGTGRRVPLAAMLDALRALARVPVPVRVDPARVRPVDQPLLLADATRLRAATGWEPVISMETMLADMLADWRTRLIS
jgi:GDP-4-dehydro-6-deoxy-D-mannose reductase